MNLQHLGAFFWLRWRIQVNQARRAGAVTAVLLGILAALAVFFAALVFVGSFLIGVYALGEAPPGVLLLVWDGLVVALLFFWSMGLLTELQRSEAVALDKFLHLPVSVAGAFLINYLGSLFSWTLLLFLPALVGLALGLVFGKGPAFLLLLPLLAAFLLALTALTYQFQSWLASLMANKRRRRTIIVLLTTVFILLSQLPNLVNILRPWDGAGPEKSAPKRVEGLDEVERAWTAGEITTAEYQRRAQELQRRQQERAQEERRQTFARVEETARLVNLVLPPGWLPLGAAGLAENNVLPALLGTLGLGLIGWASLWRAYRTTVRLYTGEYTSGRRRAPRPAAAGAEPAKAAPATAGMLARDLPGLSEQSAVIALGTFRSLLRAPEAKMMLLTPVILTVVFGSLLLTKLNAPPAPPVRPLMAFGALSMILFSMGQLLGNQFGFDRNGFRVFVLCPAPRRDILVGKNLAFAPMALGMGLLLVVVLQVVYPMRADHFLAVLPQAVTMYLLYCLLANCLSILVPLRISSGSLKPTNPRVLAVLLHLVFFFLFPPVLGLALLPLGVELGLEALGVVRGLPLHLVLSLAVCVGVVFLYRLVVTWQGQWLQARELRILEQVTSKAE